MIEYDECGECEKGKCDDCEACQFHRQFNEENIGSFEIFWKRETPGTYQRIKETDR